MNQQIVICGVGGQGVLFVTRLLAEAAIGRKTPVLTSETHGMAQRGGTVLSHLKVGDYASCLIRPGHADGMLALKTESVDQYGPMVKSDGWIVVNSPAAHVFGRQQAVFPVNADELAQQIDAPKAVNVIVLGYAFGLAANGRIDLFASKSLLEQALRLQVRGNSDLRQSVQTAIWMGFSRGEQAL
jgi:indolepyruvate ferredoxin oxidoreductase beta subunit